MSGYYKVFFFVLDTLLLNSSVLFSYFLFGHFSWEAHKSSIIYLEIYSNLAWLFLILVTSPYSVTKSWSLSQALKNQTAFIFIHSLVIMSLVVFFEREYTLLQIVFVYIFFIPLFFLTKLAVYYVRRLTSQDLGLRFYVLIGKNELAYKTRRYYLANPDLGYRFKTMIDFKAAELPLQNIREFCAHEEVHEILCCAPGITEEQLRQLVNFGLDSFIKVRVLSASTSDLVRFDINDKLLGLSASTIALDETSNQFLKRVFDILFSSLFILLIMSWLTPIIALLIKLDSKGPVFFRQLRSGKDNEPFTCLKFRTMKVNVEADTKQATKDDPRITKLGNFLRKTSLDELPQFFNVFGGSMSVVGPRPHMLRHTDEYSKLIETFMGRHYVKPGITGLAQSLGYRGETKDLSEMEGRVRLDRYYIENWTFWLDIKIIFLTVVSLIRGSEKAY